MATNTFIAGPYNATYNAVSVGLTEDGFELRYRPEKQLVNSSHLYGDTILDAVYRGGNFMLAYTMIEAQKAIVISLTNPITWPYNTTEAVMGTVGVMDIGSSLVQATVLTAVTGTTSASTPATLTASKTILAEGFEVSYQMAARLRTIPVAKRMYPYTSSSNEIWFAKA